MQSLLSKLSTNEIKSIVSLFKKELEGLYPLEETENFIYYTFGHYHQYNRIDLVAKAKEVLNESEILTLLRVIKQLKQERPIQYILGQTEFYGLPIRVNQAVLIPRQETEELVRYVIESWKLQGRKPNALHPVFGPAILDIGTGSGCIAIALKKNLENSTVYAIDVSEKALTLAKENAALNETEVHFFLADILHPALSAVTGLPPLFDIIVSNPPYVLYSEKGEMKANVLGHEPHLALFVADSDPLIFYRAIAGFATRHLTSGGQLFFEINEQKGKEVKEMLEGKGFKGVTVKKDLSGKDRMVAALAPNSP